MGGQEVVTVSFASQLCSQGRLWAHLACMGMPMCHTVVISGVSYLMGMVPRSLCCFQSTGGFFCALFHTKRKENNPYARPCILLSPLSIDRKSMSMQVTSFFQHIVILGALEQSRTPEAKFFEQQFPMHTCEDSRLLLLQLRPLQIRLPGSRLHVLLHCRLVLSGGQLRELRVLRGNDHVGGSEQGVWSRGKDFQDIWAACMASQSWVLEKCMAG